MLGAFFSFHALCLAERSFTLDCCTAISPFMRASLSRIWLALAFLSVRSATSSFSVVRTISSHFVFASTAFAKYGLLEPFSLAISRLMRSASPRFL